MRPSNSLEKSNSRLLSLSTSFARFGLWRSRRPWRWGERLLLSGSQFSFLIIFIFFGGGIDITVEIFGKIINP